MTTTPSTERALTARIAELQNELLAHQERLVFCLDTEALTCRCPLGDEHVVVVYAYDAHDDDVVLEAVVIGGDCVPIQNFTESKLSSWRMHCLRDWDRQQQLDRISGARRAA